MKQSPAEDMSDKGPQRKMLISVRGRKNIAARVLLGSGCTTPIASENWIDEHNVSYVTSTEQKAIQDFPRNTVEDCGRCFTFPITCQHGEHSSKDTFKIDLMEDSCDVRLPSW